MTPQIHRAAALGLALTVLTAAWPLAQTPRPTQRGASSPTTLVIVRHAEKATDDPRDPSLSEAGQARARDLAAVLSHANLGAIYATQYRRTRDTAGSAATAAGLSVTERPVPGGDAAPYAAALAREVLAAHAGRTVLVVGHSNTVPDLVKAFSGFTVAPLADDHYDRLFVIVIARGTGPRLIESRYGSSSGVSRP